MDQLYMNGTILTMEGKQRLPDAVLIQNGIIRYVGDADTAKALSHAPETIDLAGSTLLPAFIDAHSHLSSAASALLQADLTDCTSLEEISERVHTFQGASGIEPGNWIIARGYDHNLLPGKKHPTRAFLDACFPKHPVVLQHASGHVGVFNSKALQFLGVTENTAAPTGGEIEYASGYFEENAFFAFLKQVPMPDTASLLGAYRRAQEIYAVNGVTTVQEGYAVKEILPLYQLLLQDAAFSLDIVAYTSLQDNDAFQGALPDHMGQYQSHLRIGGYKIFLDGSPQGRTAWMREPYLSGEAGYCGYGTMTDEAVYHAVCKAAREKRQILAHCNGDAAADQFLCAIEKAGRTYDVASIRPVMIHAQLLGRDQLPRVDRAGIIPSFFIAHVYYWGDVHIQNFGRKRAEGISPAGSALKLGIPFTFHQDTPVIAPDMLETIWCAVNRVTKDGVTLGAEECISPYEALRAVTAHAAYQYGEEKDKGTIEQGKRADFVVLDSNPLTVPPERIRDIRVLRTVKDGKTLFAQ